MVPAFVKLLKDTEAEVRTAIAGQIPGTFDYVSYATCLTFDRLLPVDRSGNSSQ